MKEYEEIFLNNTFTNDEIKKFQEKENINNYNSFNVVNKYERIKVKEKEYKNIREKLNSIFKKYYEKLKKKEITTIEEFYDVVLLSFVFYEQFENTRIINGELFELRNDIKEYNTLILEREVYKKKYCEEYEKYNENFEISDELNEINFKINSIKIKIEKFSDAFFSELWEDYQNFQKFIKDEEKLIALAQLTEFNNLYEELDDISISENFIEIRNKLERYLMDIEQLEFYVDENENVKVKIEKILETFKNENDIINVLLHFSYANILIRNNIMKFPIISNEYKDNSDIIENIKMLKYNLLNYYKDDLSYRDDIKIEDNIIQNHNDTLFYDILYLQCNSEKEYKTFDNLKSSKESQFINSKLKTSEININNDKVTINCNIDDFIQISNALEMIEKLKYEDVQKNILLFLNKEDKFYKNKKFKLKSNFLMERTDILEKIEIVTRIEKELLQKNIKLIFEEKQIIFSLFEKSKNRTEDFKCILEKLLCIPYFIKKVIKNGINRNIKAYDEIYNEICEDILYIEEINNKLTNYEIERIVDIESLSKQLDNFLMFDFDTMKIEGVSDEIVEKLKAYQEDYARIIGGEENGKQTL